MQILFISAIVVNLILIGCFLIFFYPKHRNKDNKDIEHIQNQVQYGLISLNEARTAIEVHAAQIKNIQNIETAPHIDVDWNISDYNHYLEGARAYNQSQLGKSAKEIDELITGVKELPPSTYIEDKNERTISLDEDY